ncbi:BAG FAMILY MOLECULAR CHAPERONE REGULATOR 4 [Salix koriyanagi]|uniref:BAG FAMILY MOLECULAR CHAPERONE REGULATOR 4 n=1 Tax=Salix koriyanagi TaxID=2511006 RepID=A0A9Q0X3H6_9ROSI|nr:BAG FAMILY MOLECULAR CHAPERONE REGULATOR 4 [Salix koriyanagi]
MSSKSEEINHGVRQVDHNLIKINVSHGPSHHELHVPAHCTFGHVKKVIEQQTGLESEKQRILFRGKEKEDGENLQEAGVRDDSKILVLEDVVRKEMKEGEDTSKAAMQENVEEVKGNDKEMLKALRAIDETRKEIDKLAERVGALEVVVSGGTQVSEKEFVVFSEFLMRQLLKLDAIEAEGEARMQRKAEGSCSGKVVLAMDERDRDDNVELLLCSPQQVRRVQNFHDILDNLKARNSKPLGNSGNAVSVTTEWETFDSELGSSSPPPSIPSSTRITQDWERLE